MKQALVITELTRTVGIGRQQRPYRSTFHPVMMTDYFPIPLSWESFRLNVSEYGVPVDEVICPCGVAVPLRYAGFQLVIADLVQAAEQHLGEEHPGIAR